VLVTGSPERRERALVVSHQWLLHLGGSLTFARRFEVGVNLPWIISQSGDSPRFAGTAYPSPSGEAIGDLRLSGRVGVFPQRGALPGVGILVSAWLPTGTKSAYASAGQTRFGADLLLGADHGPLLWRVALGRRHQNDDSILPTGHSGWATSLGVAYRLRQWQLGPEFWGTTAADGRISAFSRRATNIEAALALRYRWSDLVFSAAGGPGLTPGPGTPRYRVIFGLAYSPRQTHRVEVEPGAEREFDVPSTQATSMQKTPAPAVAATVSMQPPAAARQLPRPDSDGDGIIDAEDACPTEPGPPNNDTEHHGCPTDGDGDGILDRDDACPDVRGESSSDPKQHGCKSAVTIRGAQLVLTQQIHFKTGSDEILQDSHEILEQLTQLLTDAPDIARVAVDGHTDNVGTENNNLSLSRRRALSVVRWLIAHGIDERRLEARGYGPKQPVVANDSDAGRARNRRVEFIILRRTDEGTRGWKDGPVHE
jgi:OmpA-OmpF porin, OOP family